MKAKSLEVNTEKIWENLEIRNFEELDSTNNYVKKYLAKNKEKEILVLADRQTKGRGRSGRNFYSKLKHGLYFSLGFSVEDTDPELLSMYTIAAASSMIQAIEKECGLKIKVKWVNDLFYQGKKVAGILAEAITNQKTNKISSLVIGIGINLVGTFDDADSSTQKSAGTLYEVLPEEFEKESLIIEFLRVFHLYHQNIESKSFLPVYEKHLLGIGQEVYYLRRDKKYEGRIEGINEQGQLLVKNKKNNIEILIADEIHFSSEQFVQEIGETNENF